MEDLQDSSFTGPSAISIAAELKDTFYFKLVDDFFGPQTGDLLDLDEKPCTNQLLVQVGLMREENDLSWVNVVKWLQKIFPMFQSADFHCLIERNTETAMSLTGDARQSFLESDINFEFVGPICDSIGIGRTDLLEMSDFSDRAKLTDVTNGLMLELTNFIAREKIDPIVLVSWLRNFDPTFCSDGKIQKANKLLQTSLQRFRIQYRNNQRSRNRKSGLFDEFLQSQFDLTPDLEDSEFRRVAVIKRHLKKKRLKLVQKKSNFQTAKIKQENQLFDISDTQAEHNLSPGSQKHKGKLLSDSVFDSYQTITVKQEHDIQSIRSVQTEVLDPEGNPRTDTGDCLTLLDISVLSLQKLMDMYGDKNEGAKVVSMDLLKNQFSVMLKEDSKMNSLNEIVMSHASNEDNPQPAVPPLHFLHCNTHFLLDFVDAVEKQVMSFEREIVTTTGDKLGRDNNPRFQSFLNFDESAVTRYIHMVCEILCSKGETNNSYRRHWLAFCIERNNPSTLPINQSNRFINYFEAAAALVHHYRDVALFVSDLQLLTDDSNIILDSVSNDASDEAIQTLVCVVAIVYCKVLGPFWQLLKSDAQYVLFSKYIFCLYDKLLQWSEDASVLLEPESGANVFLQIPVQERNFPGVFMFCHANSSNQYGTLMKACLQRMMKVLAAVVEENLKDFLPGGRYCKEPSLELAEQLASCTFSQLMGEYPFGHAYPYSKNRPDKTHVHADDSISEELDRPPTPPPLKNTTSLGVPAGTTLRRNASKPYVMFERANLRPLERMKKKRLKLMDKRQRSQRQDQLYRKMVLAAVAKNGGPCKSIQDVDRLLARMKGTSNSQTREVLRCELNYQKFIVGSRDTQLNHIGFSLSDMINKLKDVLPCEKMTSLITKPTENIVIHVESNVDQCSTTAPSAPKPQENSMSQPNEDFSRGVDVGSRGRAVVFQSHRENIFDELSPIS
ncbi:solute carrier family 52, riboflavin transporter, member 2 isoform X1 [Electrophorus electricus]|uniref:Uncharacterized protein n=1 Tax=Electrophorus electricus TaxID=8005 RepID=A0A4W4EIB4_ELEEL|nr:solute carrier family 52, riboflavin transporter, member 2 isoform X1 [Electrophorus electricus]